MLGDSAEITDRNPRFVVIFAKNIRRIRDDMTKNLVVDLTIDSMRMLEKMFILSLMLTLNPINKKRSTYLIYSGVQGTLNSCRTGYL